MLLLPVRKADPMDPVIDRYARRASPRYNQLSDGTAFQQRCPMKPATAIGWRRWTLLSRFRFICMCRFCRQMCWYCGCNMKLAARYDPVADYARSPGQGNRAHRRCAARSDESFASALGRGHTNCALTRWIWQALMAKVRHAGGIFTENCRDWQLKAIPPHKIDAREGPPRIGSRWGFTRGRPFGVQEFDLKVQNRPSTPGSAARNGAQVGRRFARPEVFAGIQFST